MKLNRFYPIVESASWVERLLPLGVRFVQLRVKERPVEYVRGEIVAAQSLCARVGACLVINDHWECALTAGCGFVHLGQTDLDSADVPALRKVGIRIGISTHSHAELDRALTFDPDYVALGPIYPTTLKRMPWAPQGLERLREWRQLVGNRALVAIGGLTVERLPGVFAGGADSAAVVTDITCHPNPEARTREWLQMAREIPVIGHYAQQVAGSPRE
jgi:thiamine-phosphate pyrophosphorylase